MLKVTLLALLFFVSNASIAQEPEPFFSQSHRLAAKAKEKFADASKPELKSLEGTARKCRYFPIQKSGKGKPELSSFKLGLDLEEESLSMKITDETIDPALFSRSYRLGEGVKSFYDT